MSSVIKCRLSQNVVCHKMSSVTKCRLSQNVVCHKMSSVTICRLFHKVVCYQNANHTFSNNSIILQIITTIIIDILWQTTFGERRHFVIDDIVRQTFLYLYLRRVVKLTWLLANQNNVLHAAIAAVFIRAMRGSNTSAGRECWWINWW